MPGCKSGCNTSELLPCFVACIPARGIQIDRTRITAAINRLCGYAEGVGKLLCEIGLAELQGFVRQLYSLEDDSYTADDSHQEIHIIGLFYDYLVSKGCVAANPVKVLKELAIEQLLERLGKKQGEGEDEQEV